MPQLSDVAASGPKKRDQYFIRIALLASPLIISILGFTYALNQPATKYAIIDVVFAIAGSIGAAVVWYLIFLILDYRNDLNRKDLDFEIRNHVAEIDAKLDASTAQTVRAFERLEPKDIFAAGKFYFVQHPREQVRQSINAVSSGSKLEVEAIGINLKAFVEDHLKTLATRSGSHLRIVVPNPNHQNLALMCEREGRNLADVQNEIIFTTKAVMASVNSGAQIKWQDEIATITLVRVNSVIFWRPRFLNDDRLASIFYHEANKSSNKLLFDVIHEEFSLLWNSGSNPDLSEMK